MEEFYKLRSTTQVGRDKEKEGLQHVIKDTIAKVSPPRSENPEEDPRDLYLDTRFSRTSDDSIQDDYKTRMLLEGYDFLNDPLKYSETIKSVYDQVWQEIKDCKNLVDKYLHELNTINKEKIPELKKIEQRGESLHEQVKALDAYVAEYRNEHGPNSFPPETTEQLIATVRDILKVKREKEWLEIAETIEKYREAERYWNFKTKMRIPDQRGQN